MTDDIHKFAEAVAPYIYTLRKFHKEPYSGKDLLLTPIKEIDGKRVEKEKTYAVEVPVVACEIKGGEMVLKDHKSAILRAWNRGKKPAVRKYLYQYFDKETVKKLMKEL